ncbi:ATP-binding response regulator [Pelagicoccus mobilis]|uniref:Hybrid sensor histidine kinase/response regulator n=1 Tax=Pelagicoccus mobilis TaxID=415221 RepID=A0A934RZ86_9BACT|nr:response regulator [Pelagicoccus mobilis]MBK1878024.1 hybrid sensor histidine kinase/response regulator [Pelagicoccus mobilis]
MNPTTDNALTKSVPAPVNVLIVDDSIHDYRSLSVMIGANTSNDYEFQWARNSEEAELKLEDGRFEIVAVDYNLGLEEGSEVIQRLSERYPGSAYIMVTGNQDPDVYKRGIQAGAVNFVQKTKDCGVIFDRMAQYAVERKRSENSLKVANASKDWLMSLLETDLATPLFALNQLLSTTFKEAENMPKEMLIELLDTAYQTSCEALVATKEMLDWGRSVHGAVRPNMQMVDVAAITHRAVRLLTTLADERGIYIAQRGVFDFKAYCDERIISTVLRNLLSAALSYSADDKTVCIESSVESGYLNLAISCEGRGIENSDFATLCGGKQEQGHNWNAKDRQAICSIQVASHMLDSMGCSLELKNDIHKGVQFSFKLPLKLPMGLL